MCRRDASDQMLLRSGARPPAARPNHAPRIFQTKPLVTALVWFLAAMLLVMPPGGSACWTLPGGLHLHIGWFDAQGQPTRHPQVFLHGETEPGAEASQANPGSAIQAPLAGLGNPLVVPALALWLFPLTTITWLELTLAQWLAQPGPSPLYHPPRTGRTS